MMVRWIAHLTVAAGVLACVLAGSARAQGRAAVDSSAVALAVALIDIEVVGGADAGLVSEIESTIARALEEEGFRPVSLSDVRSSLRARPDLGGCVTPACVRALPDLLGTDRFLRLWIEARGAAYSFELSLLGGKDGGVLQRQQAECPVCTTMEILEQVSTATRALMKAARGVPVEIVSSPEGAVLRVDGRELGTTPFTGHLPTGAHELELSLDGHAPALQTIEVAAAAEDAAPQRFEVTLTRALATPPSTGRRKPGRPYATLKWLGAATTVTALSAGVVWLAVDGNGTCGESGKECPEVYDTGTLGLVGLGVGAALGLTTGWMFWRDSEDASAAATATVAPVAGGGAMGSVHVRF